MRTAGGRLLHVLLGLVASRGTAVVASQQCPGYAEVANLANPALAGFQLQKFVGTWYEIYSHNLPILTTGCHCSRYDVSLREGGGWGTDFRCKKESGKLLELHSANKNSSDPRYPGMLTESWLLPVGHTPATAYWVIDVGQDAQGGYQKSLVYSCTELLGMKQEWLYLFSRSTSLSGDEVAEWTRYMGSKGIDTSTIKQVPQEAGCWSTSEIVV